MFITNAQLNSLKTFPNTPTTFADMDTHGWSIETQEDDGTLCVKLTTYDSRVRYDIHRDYERFIAPDGSVTRNDDNTDTREFADGEPLFASYTTRDESVTFAY